MDMNESIDRVLEGEGKGIGSPFSSKYAKDATATRAAAGIIVEASAAS